MLFSKPNLDIRGAIKVIKLTNAGTIDIKLPPNITKTPIIWATTGCASNNS